MKKPPASLKEEDSIVPAPASVSVIIPTYNRRDTLRETLESIARQTYPSDCFEVIIVDDGSTDGTSEIAAEVFPLMLKLVTLVHGKARQIFWCFWMMISWWTRAT
jgi:cellulose synthase/poly-beta-1,6-N-acetylglucosamine synthase-like glycosyltransferase